tara:strand:+ start:512 stop:811 length:300 start_codon:yes stop_codon:yes gene_type:complete
MITQTNNLEFHFDSEVCNVMYFEHDESLYINDLKENSIQVHGVSPYKMVNLMRNLVCCRDSKIKLDQLEDHEVESLRKVSVKLNEMFFKHNTKDVMKGE